MTILEGDIKLLASRVMDDVPEGGGGPTGTVIPYGGSNHIFRDITEADRAALDALDPAEPVVSAAATGIAAIAEPMPNATAKAPTRPT